MPATICALVGENDAAGFKELWTKDLHLRSRSRFPKLSLPGGARTAAKRLMQPLERNGGMRDFSFPGAPCPGTLPSLTGTLVGLFCRPGPGPKNHPWRDGEFGLTVLVC